MVRLGVIGCGRIGRVHTDSIDIHPRAELARVYDPFDAAARDVGTAFGAEWGSDVGDLGAVRAGEPDAGREPVAT